MRPNIAMKSFNDKSVVADKGPVLVARPEFENRFLINNIR